jgi:hypothetical protein
VCERERERESERERDGQRQRKGGDEKVIDKDRGDKREAKHATLKDGHINKRVLSV